MKQRNAAPTDGTKGIDNLRDLIKFIIVAVQKTTAADSNEDGKISMIEALNVITSVGFKIPGALRSFPEVRAEWKDLTKAEMDELVVWFAEEFDLPKLEHGKIEALVKESVAIIVTNYNHILRIKAILG